MNTLIFTLEYPPFKGGVANYYGNLVKRWPRPDEISALSNNENKLLCEHSCPKWKQAFYELAKAVRKEKIDHLLVGQILPLGIPAYLLSKIFKFKYSVFLHGMDFAYAMRTPRKKFMAKRILRSAQNIICSNSYVKKMASEFLKDDKKFHVVTPGIERDESSASADPSVDKQNITNEENAQALRPLNTNTFNKKNNLCALKSDNNNLQAVGALNGKIILFSLGRLVKRKGFDKVIEAMPEVLKTAPNLVYVIAGAGPEEEYLKSLAKDYGNQIKFLGEISESEKWTWLEICDIFITVSRNINGDYEGFGIVYLEANLTGKPVVAGDSGGVRDAVIHNETGLLVNPEDSREIAQAIIKLAQNSETRKKLGESGRRRALNKFRWKNKIDQIYSIIKNKKLK